MKAFDYVAPRSEDEVVELLDDQPGRTAVLAGGTDLVGLMKKMVVTPDLVVNIMEVESLKRLEQTADGCLLIGATVALDDLLASPYLADYRAVTDAILGINSMQLQAQGTVGGEMCQRPQCWYFRNGQGLLSNGRAEGDTRFSAIFGNDGPARFVGSSRLAPAMIALGARVRVIGPPVDGKQPSEGDQWIPLEDLYRIPRLGTEREIVLEPNQLCTHFLLPNVESTGSATYEVRQSDGPDFPLAAAAAAVEWDGNLVRQSRTVLGQVAPIPWQVPEVDRFLTGKRLTHETAASAAALAVQHARPLADNAYKIRLAEVAVKRAFLLAAGLETGGL